MSRANLESTHHLLHSIDCCRRIADKVRTVSLAEFRADDYHRKAIGRIIHSHLSNTTNKLVKFDAESVLVDELDSKYPSSQSLFSAASGYGKLANIVVMPELIFDYNGEVVESESPDLFLELVAKKSEKYSLRTHQPNQAMFAYGHQCSILTSLIFWASSWKA